MLLLPNRLTTKPEPRHAGRDLGRPGMRLDPLPAEAAPTIGHRQVPERISTRWSISTEWFAHMVRSATESRKGTWSGRYRREGVYFENARMSREVERL